jgi:3-deoxy-manno-octulosonate cytidylyltransferase (CMP-KDO synthetase)
MACEDTMTDACIIIPARYASSRYPAKPLAVLKGANGTPRSLLERSVSAGQRAVEQSGGSVALYVATDDDRIAAEAERIGVKVIMTDASCRNGTERVAQAVQRAGITAEIIVNLQGDTPLMPPHFVMTLIAAMRADPSMQMATPVLRCDAEAVQNFIADRAAGRVGATTVVSNRLGQALYFSKEVIPFTNGKGVINGVVPVYHHVGLYAYRPDALAAYMAWDIGTLEQLEGLEQLRFLENGHPVATVEMSLPGAVFWELNNPSDVPLIEGYLARMGID